MLAALMESRQRPPVVCFLASRTKSALNVGRAWRSTPILQTGQILFPPRSLDPAMGLFCRSFTVSRALVLDTELFQAFVPVRRDYIRWFQPRPVPTRSPDEAASRLNAYVFFFVMAIGFGFPVFSHSPLNALTSQSLSSARNQHRQHTRVRKTHSHTRSCSRHESRSRGPSPGRCARRSC